MSKVEKYFQYVTNYRNKHVEKEISKLNTTKKNSHFLNEIKYSNLQNDEKIRSNTWQNLNRFLSLILESIETFYFILFWIVGVFYIPT